MVARQILRPRQAEAQNCGLEAFHSPIDLSLSGAALASSGLRPHRVVMAIHKPQDDETRIYSPEDMQKLVSYLWEKRGQTTAQSALLYVGLGAFAGLTPAEDSSLDCAG